MPKQLTFTTYSPLGSSRYHDVPTHDGKFYRIREDKGRFEVRLCYGLDSNGISPLRSEFLKLCNELKAAQSFASRHYKEQLRKAALRAAQEVIAARPSNSYGCKLAAVRLPYKD